MKCNTCKHIDYKKSKSKVNGYYCCHPDNILGPRLVKECVEYQLGCRFPRWCPLKVNVNKHDKEIEVIGKHI